MSDTSQGASRAAEPLPRPYAPGPPADPRDDPEAAAVLARAFLRAGRLLGLTRRQLARVVGMSEASLARRARGGAIDPRSKEGELALLFVRLFRSLDALVGGSVARARAWMQAENRHLDGVPAELVQRVTGLVRAVEYLDAMRGRL